MDVERRLFTAQKEAVEQQAQFDQVKAELVETQEQQEEMEKAAEQVREEAQAKVEAAAQQEKEREREMQTMREQEALREETAAGDADLMEQIVAKDIEISNLKSQLESLQTELQTVQREMEEMSGSVAEAMAKNEALEGQLNGLDSSHDTGLHAALKDAAREASTSADTVKGKAQGMSKTQVDGVFSRLMERAAELRERVEERRTELKKERMDGIERVLRSVKLLSKSRSEDILRMMGVDENGNKTEKGGREAQCSSPAMVGGDSIQPRPTMPAKPHQYSSGHTAPKGLTSFPASILASSSETGGRMRREASFSVKSAMPQGDRQAGFRREVSYAVNRGDGGLLHRDREGAGFRREASFAVGPRGMRERGRERERDRAGHTGAIGMGGVGAYVPNNTPKGMDTVSEVREAGPFGERSISGEGPADTSTSHQGDTDTPVSQQVEERLGSPLKREVSVLVPQDET
ncbi:hypothetical protein KIPB_009111, partial [Kipferlia bialata]|eukprot:g9111.t1